MNARKDSTIHLVSDASGTTLQGLVRACLSQFEDINPNEKFWPLIRSTQQLDRVIEAIQKDPGPVFFTLVNDEMRRYLRKACNKMDLLCMPVLDPIIKGMSSYYGVLPKGIPGLQHVLDDAYFHRIDAMDFALSFDDGQNLNGLEEAEVILTGVSRTSKTPTCIFLARRGIRAANVPFVPNVPFPEIVAKLSDKILVVALTESPDRLIALRKSRLKAGDGDKYHEGNTYLDPDAVEQEIRDARKYFVKHSWPVIDVTRRSIEETAAEIQILMRRKYQSEQA